MKSRYAIPRKKGQVHFCIKARALIRNWSDPKPTGVNTSLCINFREFWIRPNIIPVVMAHCLISVKENSLISFFRRSNFTSPNVNCVDFFIKSSFTTQFVSKMVKSRYIFRISFSEKLCQKLTAPKFTPHAMEVCQWGWGEWGIKKLDNILLCSETFGYCSVLLSWDTVSLCVIAQAFPVIVSYPEFALKSMAPLHETPWQDTAVWPVNFILR